jgi:pilus assembly protein CpaC
MRQLISLLATFALAAAPGTPQEAPAPTVVSGTGSPRELVVTVGKSILVESPVPIERIAVGLGDFAHATAVSAREILLDGKAPGETSLIVWQEGGHKMFFNVVVERGTLLTNRRVDAVSRRIAEELPGQSVELSWENDAVFLRGSVRDMSSATRAFAIASTLGKTVNLLYVDVPPAEPQILLKVKFASVDRSLSSQLGMNILSTGATNTVGAVSTKEFSPNPPATITGKQVTQTLADALNLFFFRPDLNLGATIQALQVKGLLQVLAEPDILAENGKEASFLAGGEFPFPTVQSAGTGGTPTVSIQFREFGVRLVFTPEMTPRGTIHLRVNPEVSALDFTNGLSVSGFNVPALTTRKLNTEVELAPGQSFAIGGLLDNRITDVFEKIPFIGDIPILGKFFQSKSVSRQNTELVVIVTPELVAPIPAGQTIPQLNFPRPFLPANSAANTTSQGGTPSTPRTVRGTVPIEVLTKTSRAPGQQVPPPAIAGGPAQTQ